MQIKKYFEKQVSLLSTSDVRYKGALYAVDPSEQKITLKHVNYMGTEGRKTGDKAVAPTDCTYEFIIFRAVNIRELWLDEGNGKKRDLKNEILTPLRSGQNVNHQQRKKRQNMYYDQYQQHHSTPRYQQSFAKPGYQRQQQRRQNRYDPYYNFGGGYGPSPSPKKHVVPSDKQNKSEAKIAKNDDDELSIIRAKVTSLSEVISQLQNEVKLLKKENIELRSYVFEEKKNDDAHDENIENVSSELLVHRQKFILLQQQIDNIANKGDQKNQKVAKKEALRKWLKETVDLEEYFDLLVENGFDDLESIKIITMNELNLLGIEKLGHKMKLLKWIAKLNAKEQDIAYHEGGTAYI